MFLPYVSEFVEFLSIKEHTLDEILAHLTLRVLTPLDASAVFLVQLNHESMIENVALFGVSKELQNLYPNNYGLDENLPVPDAIRSRSTVWINTLPNWPSEYSQLKSFPPVHGAKSFICFPIEKCMTPVAA